jgi:hypothetical protein
MKQVERSADYWLGQAAVFRAVEALESTVSAGLRAWAGAEAGLAERAAERAAEPCTARIWHGPGHQSSTGCELAGPHDWHRAVYGSFRQEAMWQGPKVFTGIMDEPPAEAS